MPYSFFDRDRSWLNFNRRVMDEARDYEAVPLLERLRFLAIYSNNLDDFYATRVALLQRLAKLSWRKQKLAMNENVQQLLDDILEETKTLNTIFEQTYAKIIKALRDKNIFIVNEKELNITQQAQLVSFYQNSIRTKVTPVMLSEHNRMPNLRAHCIYLATILRHKDSSSYALVEVPDTLPRFYELKARANKRVVILLEDIIRFNLDDIFRLHPHLEVSAYTFKISRDAELNFNDDISHGVLENLNRTLKQRHLGSPVRLVYDVQMPDELLQFLMHHLRYEKENTVPGMRYHNLKDFMDFPDFGNKSLTYDPLPVHPAKEFIGKPSMLDVICKRDVMLAFPYQSFDNIIHLLQEAACDPRVTTIYASFYRLASQSEIANALIKAVENGKKVIAIVELKARFDEERNIEWSERLAQAGLHVHLGFPNYKIHAKLFLIERTNNQGDTTYISHIGTGNFNEKTSRVYQDISILTAHPEVGQEVYQVFQFLVSNPFTPGDYTHLLVSPINLRQRIERMITREIALARRKKRARIMIKVNNLTDTRIITRLYEASNAGVQIRIIARSNICLVPGVPHQSENIQVIRLVDRFLEHARIYWFSSNGRNVMYTGSADLMKRNLNHRIEVLLRVQDPKIRKKLQTLFEVQWADTLKARSVDSQGANQPRKGPPLRSQYELGTFFAPTEGTITPTPKKVTPAARQSLAPQT